MRQHSNLAKDTAEKVVKDTHARQRVCRAGNQSR